jgi:hypothetical protein
MPEKERLVLAEGYAERPETLARGLLESTAVFGSSKNDEPAPA